MNLKLVNKPTTAQKMKFSIKDKKKRCVRTFFVSYGRKPFDNFSKFHFVVRTGECRKNMWKKAIMYVPPTQNHLHKNGRECRNCSFV